MRLARGIARLLGLLVLGLAVGFAGFVATAHQGPGLLPRVDGIVALTGGAERIETALRLLDAGKANMLLVSGVAHGAGLSDLARRADMNPALLAPHVTLGRVATTTLGNAEEAAEWAREHDFHSLIIVTAGYHMPRAMLEMRRAMPDVTLYAVPVQPASLTRSAEARVLLGEYAKLLAAWVGISHIVRQPLALVRQHPAAQSANG